VELRELQERNALVLQDIAEFTIRYVEAEAYVKKLLMAKNIELPCFLPSTRSLISPCESSMHSTSSMNQPLKSTSRMSIFTSSRESIGSVVKIEPQLEKRMYIEIKNNSDTKYICNLYVLISFTLSNIRTFGFFTILFFTFFYCMFSVANGDII